LRGSWHDARPLIKKARGGRLDVRAYARNLKIARTLQRQGWHLTRIARIEVRDASKPTPGLEPDDIDFDQMGREAWLVRSVLPFPEDRRYPRMPSMVELIPELATPAEARHSVLLAPRLPVAIGLR
jgi:hypothetical protein